jgi:hypothetical protein
MGLFMRRTIRFIWAVTVPFLVAGVVVLGILLYGGRPLASIWTYGPLLSLDPSPKYLCKAHQGDVIIARFTIHNISGEAINVLGAASNCGCTTVKTNFPFMLPPDGQAVIDVQVHVGPPDAEGLFTKQSVLYVDRSGAIPPFVVEATVIKGSSQS